MPDLSKKLKENSVLLGLSNMYPAAGIIEGMCRGWDFVWIDGQHGQMSYDAIVNAVRAAEIMDLFSVLRSPTHDPGMLGKYADTSASAIMVPVVDTPDQARAVVNALRFAPKGSRSFGGRRPIDLNGRDYYKTAEPVIIAQIESCQAIENVDAIAQTDGVDMLFFGPDDMRVQLGLPMNTPIRENKDLKKAFEQTALAAKKANKAAGTVAPTPADLAYCIQHGYRLIAGGGDIVFLRQSAATRLQQLRETVENPESAAQPDPTGQPQSPSAY